MWNEINHHRKTIVGLLLILIVFVWVQIACNGCSGCSGCTPTKKTETPEPSETPDVAEVTMSGYDVRMNKNRVFSSLDSVNDFDELNDKSWHDLISHGKVTTDVAGQAELCPDSNIDNASKLCTDDACRIYVFDSSGLQINTCQEVDLGGDFCSEQGTQTFDECHVTVVTLSANATGLGTWFSMTYLLEQELTLLIVAEGEVEVVPVTELNYTYEMEGEQIKGLEIEERVLDEAQIASIYVDPTESNREKVMFYFTAPDDRLEEYGLWDLPEVAPRNPLPVEKLPTLVEHLAPLAPRLEPWIEKIYEQAKTDGVIGTTEMPQISILPPANSLTVVGSGEFWANQAIQDAILYSVDWAYTTEKNFGSVPAVVMGEYNPVGEPEWVYADMRFHDYDRERGAALVQEQDYLGLEVLLVAPNDDQFFGWAQMIAEALEQVGILAKFELIDQAYIDGFMKELYEVEEPVIQLGWY